jgi:hypothetical protein
MFNNLLGCEQFIWTSPSSREENQPSKSHSHKNVITGPSVDSTPQLTNRQLSNRLDMDTYHRVVTQTELINRNS